VRLTDFVYFWYYFSIHRDLTHDNYNSRNDGTIVVYYDETFSAYGNDNIRVVVAKVYRAIAVSYYYYILASTDEDTTCGGVEVMVETENENQYYNACVYLRLRQCIVVRLVLWLLWVTDITEKVKRGAVKSRLQGNKSSKRLKKKPRTPTSVCTRGWPYTRNRWRITVVRRDSLDLFSLPANKGDVVSFLVFTILLFYFCVRFFLPTENIIMMVAVLAKHRRNRLFECRGALLIVCPARGTDITAVHIA
jgi:hypothetical protein